jgi:hypothetical protein
MGIQTRGVQKGAELTNWRLQIVAPTGAGATVTWGEEHNGAWITNGSLASGALTITLPTPSAVFKGCWGWASHVVGTGHMTIGCATSDSIVAFNDATADSVALSTAADKIGGSFMFACDGSKWVVMPMNYADGVLVQTLTIAT